jgi:transcriptional repressor NrdR
MVVKSQGGREPFDRDKLERGITQAIRKRPVSPVQVEEILNEIEDTAAQSAKSSHEVSSRRLGEMILDRLYELDRVAYVRFASVYRNFENVEEFVNEIESLKDEKEQRKRADAGASGDGTAAPNHEGATGSGGTI